MPPPTVTAHKMHRVQVQRIPPSHASENLNASGPGTPPPQRDQTTGVEVGGGGSGRADWVRQLIEGLWPYVRGAAERLAREEIPGQLEASRPPWVYAMSLERFSLGEARPEVRHVRVHRGDGGGLEELFVEFEAEWRSQQDICIYITVPRLPVAVAEVTPDPLEEALRLVLQLRVALKDAWIRAGVRVSLCPLLHRLPVVGAIQAGLTRLPEFGYELDLSVASAALVPLIREWLDGAIRDMVLQPWVLPEHYFLPIDAGVRDVERPAGVLAVTVLGAIHVPKPGLLGTPRPLLELFLRDSQRRQTCAAPAGTSADWSTPRFEFPVSVPEHQQLTVVLYSYQEWAPNEELGRATLALRELPAGQEQEVELAMKPTAEHKHEEAKQRMDGLSRVAMFVGRPFTKKGSSLCRLRLKVTYLPLSEREVQLAVRQSWSGSTGLSSPSGALTPAGSTTSAAVAEQPDDAAAAPFGAKLHPLVLRMLHSGLLVVNVKRAEGLPAGAFFKPYYKAVVQVATRDSGWQGGEVETDAAQANGQGVVEFSRPASMHLPTEAVRDQAAQVAIELVSHGWMGGAASCGSVMLQLQEVVTAGRVEGERQLSGAGRVQLEVHYRPYF